MSNLTKVERFKKVRKYKLIKAFKALKIPFSGNSADKTYKKDEEITADKYFGDYVRVESGDDPVEGHWIEKSAIVWADPVDEDNFVSEANNATEIGDRFTGGDTAPACNICVRSALLLLKEDKALFPKEGSAYYDPYNSFAASYPKGYITNPGRAKDIKYDFDVLTTKADLSVRFTEIKKKASEGWPVYFKRLQDKADAGKIVIGTMLSSSGSSGHAVMITPGGLVDISRKEGEAPEPKWGESFTFRQIVKVPKVLECGTGMRENEAPLCRSVDYNGAIKRLKWFEYVQ